MKVSQARVQNYKIVRDSGWVDIDEQITTLVGKNESGKTSILEAIASFSTNSEYKNRNLHNKKDYPNKERIPVVSIRFEIEDADPIGYQQLCEDSTHDNLIQFTKYADGSKRLNVDLDYEEMAWERGKCVYSTKIKVDQLESWLENANTNTGNLKSDLPEVDDIVFDNPQGVYSELKESEKKLENKEMNENSDLNSINDYLMTELNGMAEEVDRVISDTISIFDNLVEMQYYDDIEMIDDKVKVNELNEEEHGALLKLFKSHDIDLKNREGVDEGELARTISDDINRDISDAINNIWGQKSVDLEIDLIDDTIVINLRDVSVRRPGDDDTGNISTRSVDRPSGPLSERSRGYKWFIAFYLNYSSDLSGTNQDLLLLFDDPAVYLHPKGKRDWLDAIENVSSHTQIVYSSHSPFLISKEYPERLRMVEDVGEKNGDHGTQVTDEFSESSKGTLEPIRKSLGIRLGDSPFVSNRNLFVEGLSEYHILFGISHYLKHKKGEDDILDISEDSIIAVDGARKMSTFGKWAESEGFAYALLLDNDQEGQDVKETISEKHTEIEPDRIVLLDKEDTTNVTCIEIEDMFSPKTYIECLNDVYSSEFDDFEEIDVRDVGDKWEIGGYEYDGEDIVGILENIIESQDIGIDELMKKDVAIEIKRRLMSNPDIPEETEANFKKLLGTLRATTGS